jgi:GNAT superfamily N-acetyltransferase
MHIDMKVMIPAYMIPVGSTVVVGDETYQLEKSVNIKGHISMLTRPPVEGKLYLVNRGHMMLIDETKEVLWSVHSRDLLSFIIDPRDLQVNRIIDYAMREAFLNGAVEHQTDANLVVIYHEGKTPVGVCWPYTDSSGHNRIGPLFVLKEFRGQGIATAFVIRHFALRTGRAYIDDANLASIKVFTKAGFVKSGRTHIDERTGALLHEYLRTPK